MSNARLASWVIVGAAVCLPINWFRLYIFDPSQTSSFGQLVLATLISLSFAAALSFFLIKSAKGTRIQRAKRALMLQELAARPLTPIRPTQALLQRGEVAYASLNATLSETQTVGYTAQSSGVSVRVMKGVRVHSGGTRGHAVKGVVAVASGELVITNLRVIFAGDAKSFSIQLPKLINVTNYSDGIAFHDDHKTYVLGSTNVPATDAFAITLQKVLDERSESGSQLRQVSG
jgi:hypothetical protein